jgi:SH3-like domain-containing protein
MQQRQTVSAATPQTGHRRARAKSAIGLALLLALGAGGATVAQQPVAARPEGAPRVVGPAAIRFASLKADRVHLRQGPALDQKVLWVYRRAGLPVEVLREHDGWLEVRDSEAVAGWVLGALVSARRTALVLPWELKPGVPPPQVALRAAPSHSSATVALIEAGVIAGLLSCDRRWCRVTIDDLKGYVEQAKLWGVYENEELK